MDTVPFEIHTSKNRRIEWSLGAPQDWKLKRIPGAYSFYSELKNKARISFELIPTTSGMCWITHYWVEEDLTLNIKSDGEFFNLYYLLEGEASYRSKSQAAVVSAGQFNIIRAAAVRHQLGFQKEKGMIALNLFIATKVIRHYQETFPFLTQVLMGKQDYRDATILADNVEDDGRLKQVVDPWWAKGLSPGARDIEMEKFLFYAFDQLEMSIIGSRMVNEAHLEALRKVRIRILDARFNRRPPSLKGLSKMVGMHEKMLERLFKSTFGKNMLQFFHQTRMEAIYRRLRCSEKTLQEIALEFSYEEYANFSAAVKRRYDQAPSQIRKTSNCKH